MAGRMVKSRKDLSNKDSDFILQVHVSQTHAVYRLSVGREDFRQYCIFLQEVKGMLG